MVDGHLRHLKHVLIGLAANHTLPWKVVAAIFRMIPGLRGGIMKFTCLDVTKAALGEPQKQSGDELHYRCPIHDDHNPSLAVNGKKDELTIAIKGLTDRSGRPTNAVFGFTNMLRKLIAEEKPEFLFVLIFEI